MMKISQRQSTGVLIVGGGLAAMKAAYECGRQGVKTLVAVKDRLCSGASFYPFTGRLGCQAPRHADPGDRELFMDEMYASSMGMHDRELCRIYVDEIEDRVRELPDMGIPYHLMEKGRVACFARRKRDIYYWEDWNAIRGNLRAILDGMESVTVMERTSVLSLIKSHGRIVGAVAVNALNELISIEARAVILATGGFGDLYQHNLNTPDVSGDGHVLALSAGARLKNLEFIQFIPGFMSPKYKVLFGEPALRYCTALTDRQGRDILSGLLPAGVTARTCFQLRSGHGPFTSADESRYFDIAMMKQIKAHGDDAVRIRFDSRIMDDTQDYNYWYVTWMRDTMHIDLSRDELSIGPFAHASNGGVVIGPDAGTGAPGLFAAGELAGSMHGADRHGGNSSGNCLVFGKRAAQSACRWAAGCDGAHVTDAMALELLDHQTGGEGKSALTPDEVMDRVRLVMARQACIVRDERGLTEALSQVDELARGYRAGAFTASGAARAVKARNFITLSGAVLLAMQARRESRGAHYREDYPAMDDERYGRPILWRQDADRPRMIP